MATPPHDLFADPSGRARSLRRPLVEVTVILLTFVVVGLAAGWLWETLWHPTQGVVVDGQWYDGTRVEGEYLVNDFPGLRGYFDATASFALIGAGAGLVLGLLAAVLARSGELVVLGAVAVGSVLACVAAYRLGVHLGPPDPAGPAATAANATVLDTNLYVKGHSPFLTWSFGALLGLGATYFLTTGLSETRRRDLHDAHV